MKLYPPSQLTLKESKASSAAEQLELMDVSDETLRFYPEGVLAQYRAVIEQHFGNLASYLALYVRFPYEVTIVRIGPNGVLMAFKPAALPSVKVMGLEDFVPPIQSINLFDIQARLEGKVMSFDFRLRTYDAEEAKIEGTRMALGDALHFLWMGIDAETFEKLCLELLEAEDITDEMQIHAAGDISFDATREVMLNEPAGFRRAEKWAFQFKHHKDNRISATIFMNLRVISMVVRAKLMRFA